MSSTYQSDDWHTSLPTGWPVAALTGTDKSAYVQESSDLRNADQKDEEALAAHPRLARHFIGTNASRDRVRIRSQHTNAHGF